MKILILWLCSILLSSCMQMFNPLNQDTAFSLAEEKWGICNKYLCESMSVRILQQDSGNDYIEIIFEWLRDDSIESQRIIMESEYVDWKWRFWDEVSRQYKCQQGRGQTNFSSELCI